MNYKNNFKTKMVFVATIILLIIVGFLYPYSSKLTNPRSNSGGVDEKIHRLADSQLVPAHENSIKLSEKGLAEKSFPNPRMFVPEISMPKLAQEFTGLAERANTGDIEAATALYKGLWPCRTAPRTQADVNGMINAAEVTYGKGTDGHRSASDFANKIYKGCSAFTHEQRDSSDHWLALAASLGDSKAQLDYINVGAPIEAIEGEQYSFAIQEYQRLGKKYLDAQLSAGNVDALLAASAAYADRNLFAPDIEQQYAYKYAYILATDTSSGVFFDGMVKLQRGMPQETIDHATQLGTAIYNSCCYIKH